MTRNILQAFFLPHISEILGDVVQHADNLYEIMARVIIRKVTFEPKKIAHLHIKYNRGEKYWITSIFLKYDITLL